MSKVRRGVYILPNLFTSANLFCGFFAIVYTVEQAITGGNNFRLCAVAIIAATLFDALDGRVARRTKTASRFGTEYDSLCDLVSFGVAPALTLYVWAFRDFGRPGWLAAFLYLACGALRLARFNVQSSTVEKKYFEGLPIPMAAMMVAGAVLIWEGSSVGEATLIFPGDVRLYLLGLTYLLAGLMVSTIPYRSFKAMNLTGQHPFYSLVLVIIGLMVWATKPVWVLFLLGCVYILSGPTERYLLAPPVRVYRRAQRRHRVKKSLTKMDRIAARETPKETNSGPENSSHGENVHSLRKK